MANLMHFHPNSHPPRHFVDGADRRPSASSYRIRGAAMMCAINHNSTHTGLSVDDADVKLMRSNVVTKSKVFEDPWAGIVCYKNEDGEITCEGYDEGPRFQHHSISTFSLDSCRTNVEMFKRCWQLQSVEEKRVIGKKTLD